MIGKSLHKWQIASLKPNHCCNYRAENLLHEYFGNEEYWAARRSMRFAGHLVQISDEFRKSKLNSNDVKDFTSKAPKWEIHQPKRGTAKGGPYICAHVRRKDYTFSRKDSIPGEICC